MYKEVITIISLLVLYQSLIPFIGKKLYVFGVAFPEDIYKRNKAELKRIKLFYFSFSIILSVLFIFLPFILTQNEALLYIGFIIFCCSSIVMFGFFSKKTLKLMKNDFEFKAESIANKKTIYLMFENIVSVISTIWFIIPSSIILLIWYTLIYKYDELSNNIPIHWGINGTPDAFKEKSLYSVSLVPFISLILVIALLLFNIFIKKSKQNILNDHKQDSLNIAITNRRYYSILLYTLSLVISISCVSSELSFIYPDLISTYSTNLISIVLLLALIVVFFLYVKKSTIDENRFLTEYSIKTASDLSENDKWKWGYFYYSNINPSILVERRSGLGWTLNFASPIAWIIVIILIALALL